MIQKFKLEVELDIQSWMLLEPDYVVRWVNQRLAEKGTDVVHVKVFPDPDRSTRYDIHPRYDNEVTRVLMHRDDLSAEEASDRYQSFIKGVAEMTRFSKSADSIEECISFDLELGTNHFDTVLVDVEQEWQKVQFAYEGRAQNAT